MSYLVISKYYDVDKFDVFLFSIDFEQSSVCFNKKDYSINFEVFENKEAACNYIVSKLGFPLVDVIYSDCNEFLKCIIDALKVKK